MSEETKPCVARNVGERIENSALKEVNDREGSVKGEPWCQSFRGWVLSQALVGREEGKEGRGEKTVYCQ
jgi:hypothetical protein